MWAPTVRKVPNQRFCLFQLIKYLRKEWVDLITTNVRMCLQDVGKGWFNIREKSWKIYELSKLSRYMELIKFRMQTSLKYLVENSTDLLVKLVETPCLSCQDVPDENFVWGDDLNESPFQATGPPIFKLTLKISNVDASYSTSPDSFEVSVRHTSSPFLKVSPGNFIPNGICESGGGLTPWPAGRNRTPTCNPGFYPHSMEFRRFYT